MVIILTLIEVTTN